jgi:phosphatidylserine/phosphatidylglycerophosphate/cardiolipin synthase-like enzyme
VLTTTYTDSTEAQALDALQQVGAQVRVSYEQGGTRLHAKAFLFHRDSGFSTAYIGSSNLTHTAQVTDVPLPSARRSGVLFAIALKSLPVVDTPASQRCHVLERQSHL